MEFLEAVKTYHKMCERSHCESCWFRRFHLGIRGEVCSKRDRTVMSCDEIAMKFPAVLTAAVNRWVEEHPPKTMLDIFHEAHPDGEKLPNGSVRICPYHIDRAYGGLCTDGSGDCKACWSREVDT